MQEDALEARAAEEKEGKKIILKRMAFRSLFSKDK